VQGTLRLGHAQALGSSTGPVTINAGTLDLRGFDQRLTDLSGGGGSITDNLAGAGTTTVAANILSGSTTYGGSINNGTGGRILKLVKSGPGALILTKANGHNYGGGTVLEDGRLEIRTNNAQVLPAGSNVTVTGNSTFAAVNNGALTVTDAGLTLGSLTLAAGDATIESNQLNASTTNRLTFAGAPIRAAGATGNFSLTVASDPSLYRVGVRDSAGDRPIDRWRAVL
jgi:autotransporter-associated beta strand protein